MTTQSIRKDDYLSPGLVAKSVPARRTGRVGDIVREAVNVIRGVFEVPLRQARRDRALGAAASLDEATRRDIGL